MAQNVYRCNLKATSIPLLTDMTGRTVIMRGADANYVPGLVEKSSNTEADSSMGIPQLLYCHNVMPTYAGYKSVTYPLYTTSIPSIGGSIFVDRVAIRDGDGNAAELGVTSGGEMYIMKRGETYWTGVVGAPANYDVVGKRLTAAYVSGITYIYVERKGCYVYNFSTGTMIPVTLNGLDMSTIIGVVGCFGYLLAYSVSAMAWSSTVDPTDFVPSLTTGAGGGQVENAKGRIVSVIMMTNYLVVFTDTNAVAAQFSNNARYPFIYTEIANCGGLYDHTYASTDSNGTTLYAYTTSGLQSVAARQATTIYPEITDFLSGGKFQDFDVATKTFTTTLVENAPILKRVVVIADRYLVISYCPGTVLPFTHAIIFDLAMKEFTRLKVVHTTCFELSLYEQDVAEVPRKSIAFLRQSGHVRILDFDLTADPADEDVECVAIFGRYQHHRARMINLQEVEVESPAVTDTMTCTALTSLEGGASISSAVDGYLSSSMEGLRRYNFDVVGTNVSLLFTGKFNLSSMLIHYNLHGRRV